MARSTGQSVSVEMVFVMVLQVKKHAKVIVLVYHNAINAQKQVYTFDFMTYKSVDYNGTLPTCSHPNQPLCFIAN